VKTVRVDEEVWEKLMELRTKSRARSVNEVLRRLLGLATAVGRNPQPEPPRTARPQPSQPEAAAAAAGNQPSQPATPPAGTDAAPPRLRRRWSFCPQCLSMYDHQGKCPSCNVDLVPLDADEGRRLYIEMKRERGRG